MWREPGMSHGIKTWEAWCYAGGWFALFVALVSPLHPWESVLLSAHMTQHEILMLVAAPLVVLGRPILVYLHALPRAWAAGLGRASNHPAWRSTWSAISHPLAAFLIHSVLLWVWHAPALFNATLTSDLVHTLQHLGYKQAAARTGGDPHRGRAAIHQYGCASCHTIPGVAGADALVGPSLAHIASRTYLGGVIDNNPDNLVRWILDPPAVDPKTAMPNLKLSESDARDIAGYLYTLK
jgi:cytochrome c551/c552